MSEQSDAKLLRDAIDASGRTAASFATDVLGVDRSTPYRWERGERRMEEPTRRLLCAIITRPELADALEAAGYALSE